MASGIRYINQLIIDCGCKKVKWNTVEVEIGLLRNNGLTFPLIKNEYIYIYIYIYIQNLKHKNRKQSTQNIKIGDNPRIRGLQQK